MDKFTRLTATACPLNVANLNTDQIVPARFLKRPRSTLALLSIRISPTTRDSCDRMPNLR